MNSIAAVRSDGPEPQPAALAARRTAPETLRNVLLTTASWLRAPEFLIGIAFVFGRATVAFGVPIEVPLICLVLLIASFIRPTVKNKALTWVAPLLGTTLCWVVLVSVINHQPWQQRTFRLFLLFALACVLAEGRLRWKSMLAGLVFGLVFINTPAYYLHLTSDNYHPYLTGFIGDKNVAGMYYPIFGILGLTLYRSKKPQLAHLLMFAGLTFATGSRTGMGGFALGIVWWLTRNRLPRWARWALLGLGIWALNLAESQLAEIGVFADRTGTDWFRAQIAAATSAKLAHSPWYGSGLNTAWVYVTGQSSMWFHDSYAALRIEGGYPLLAAIVGLMAIGALGVLSGKRHIHRDLLGVEAAIVVLLVVAWKLGEVFFTFPSFFLIGVALLERYGESLSGSPGSRSPTTTQSVEGP